VPNTAPYFSVLIVNYNSGDQVQAALSSLASQTFRDFEVIVIDNASIDGSADALHTSGLSNFRLVRQSENIGFAAGNNRAAELASGQWLVLLNPDATARADWLGKIADGIRRHPDCGSFACTQFATDNPDLLDGAGDNYLVFGIPWRGGYRQPAGTLPGEGECFSACGASAVIRADLFRALEGFDERLFCYCEDVDLGYRMRLQGQKTIFLPNAVIYHLGGGVSDQVSGFAVFHGTRNRLWVFLKNTPLALLWWTLPVHIGLTLLILLRGTMTGRLRHTWKGLMAGIAGIPGILAARKGVQASRTVDLACLLRLMPLNPLRMLSRSAYVIPITDE